MDLRHICQTTVATVSVDDSVQDAVWAMRDNHVGDLVVVERKDGGAQIPRGILTDRDIVIDLLAEGVDALGAIPVGEVMSDGLIMADHDATPDEALETMQANGIRRLPIVDHQGTLFGIVTLDDMLSYLTHHMAALASVVGAGLRKEMQKDEV